MANLYAEAIAEHVQQCMEQLNQLSDLANARGLTELEYRASERLLQLLIESGVGVAKHWLKSVGRTAPADAYQVFAKLCQLQLINDDELTNWKKMIGLRNALVHDYLNIDLTIISDILKQRYYVDVQSFVKRGCQGLARNDQDKR